MVDLNKVIFNENAKMHPRAPAPYIVGEYMYKVNDKNEVIQTTITKVEKAWYAYIFGGVQGIYVYTYLTPSNELVQQVSDGTMFSTKIKALAFCIGNYKSKIEENIVEIEELLRKIDTTVDEIAGEG